MRKWIVMLVAACALSATVLASPRASAAKGHFYLVVDSSNEAKLHCSSMLEDFWACMLNATDFDDVISKYHGTTLRAVSPMDFTGAFVVDAAHCGNPDSPGWEAMLQCVIDTAKITVVDGDYVLYVPPTGTWDTRNCSICYVNSGGKRVSIRGAFNQSAKCDGYTFGSIHETFEANTWGGSDDCCNGYYASGVKEASSCVSMFGSTGGETTMKCGYKSDWHVQRITYGPRSDGYFYGEDCFLVKETAAAGSPATVCMLPKAQRLAGKCIAGNVVTCEYTPKETTCTDGCFEDTTGAHCTEFGATCTVSAPASVCGGATAKVTVTCKNGGNQPWDASLELVTIPQASASPIADASWISPTVPASVSPAAVAPSASGTFTFLARAPKTTTKTTVTQELALQEKGASAPHATPAPFTLSLEVDPCDGDGGVGGDGGTNGDASTNGDAPGDVSGGCACSTRGRSDARSGYGVALAALALSIAFVRRRR